MRKKKRLQKIPYYNPRTIMFAEEPFGTDVAGSPSETINHDLLARIRVARDAREAATVQATKRKSA